MPTKACPSFGTVEPPRIYRAALLLYGVRLHSLLQKVGQILSISMYYVYALRSLTRNYIYVGLTDDLERRVSQHNNGLNRTTKPYAPFVLIYVKEFSTRIEARKKEKYLKSGVGKGFLRGIES